jgi:hypothetical protein
MSLFGFFITGPGAGPLLYEWRIASHCNGPQQAVFPVSPDWMSSIRNGDALLRGVLNNVGIGAYTLPAYQLDLTRRNQDGTTTTARFDFEHLLELATLIQAHSAAEEIIACIPETWNWLCSRRQPAFESNVPRLASYGVRFSRMNGERLVPVHTCRTEGVSQELDCDLAGVLDTALRDHAGDAPIQLEMNLNDVNCSFEFRNRAELSYQLTRNVDLVGDMIVPAIPRTVAVACGPDGDWESAEVAWVNAEIWGLFNEASYSFRSREHLLPGAPDFPDIAENEILVSVGAVGAAPVGSIAEIEIGLRGIFRSETPVTLRARSFEELRQSIHASGFSMAMWQAMPHLMSFLHSTIQISDALNRDIERVRGVIRSGIDCIGREPRELVGQAEREMTAALAIPPELLGIPVLEKTVISFEGLEGEWEQEYEGKTLAEAVSIQLELIKELRNTVDAERVMIVRIMSCAKYIQMNLDRDWHHRNTGEADLAGAWLLVMAPLTPEPALAAGLRRLVGEQAWGDPGAAPDRLPDSSYVHVKIATRRGDAYVTAYVIPLGRSIHEAAFAFCSPESQFDRSRGREIARKRHADGQKVLLASGGVRSRHDMIVEWISSLRDGTKALCTLQEEHTVPLPRWLLPEPQVMSERIRALLQDLARAAERFEDSTHDAALVLQSFGRQLESLGPLETFSSTWAPSIHAVSDDELNNVGAGPEPAGDEGSEFDQIFDQLIEQECSQ